MLVIPTTVMASETTSGSAAASESTEETEESGTQSSLPLGGYEFLLAGMVAGGIALVIYRKKRYR